MIGYLLFAVCVWGWVMWRIDRIDQPAYITRDSYKWLSLLLIILLAIVIWRAESWHTQLKVTTQALLAYQHDR